MKTIYHLSEINPAESNRFGGKAIALSKVKQAGFKVPETLCIATEAYKRFIRTTGLQEKIQLELHRKKFSDLRWEEIWDAALRIRNMFIRSRVPEKLGQEIADAIGQKFGNISVVIRSSAPDEDARATSFAGLHESFVNIRGAVQILNHVKLVWASLWSDRALLYRRELGLNITRSAMAVLVQELIPGNVSGVAFSINPADRATGIVEAVYGLNQGLVDGSVEPDHWLIARKNDAIKLHRAPDRHTFMLSAENDVVLKELSPAQKKHPPLRPEQVKYVFGQARKLEQLFEEPQDVEWTISGSEIFILQSRPVTAKRHEVSDDKRGWYLSLHRSYENLKKLQRKIENEHLPGMKKAASRLSGTKLDFLTDQELVAEIVKRKKIKEKWTTIYWDDFIPFAHGMRIFGRFYNDSVKPEDPFEFVELLVQTPLLSTKRNAALEKIVSYVLQRPALQELLSAGAEEVEDPAFLKLLEEFVSRFGDPFCGTYDEKSCSEARSGLIRVIRQMINGSRLSEKRLAEKPVSRKEREKVFLGNFTSQNKRDAAEKLLELARASYRMRDDDNILLGRIEEQFTLALQKGKNRLQQRGVAVEMLEADDICRSLIDKDHRPAATRKKAEVARDRNFGLRARQLLGQPAGAGIARGRARVIHSSADLGLFKKGEILVCDAIDPNMTLVVPLAAGIVERRGGMLIHGAIIAREYGIACVTGVPDAAAMIQTGDLITVDGYLGIVTVSP